MNANRTKGFTLIEILVAVAVFAVAGAMAYAGLAAVVRTEQRLDAEQQAFRSVVVAVDSLASDLASAVHRPVRAANGASLPTLVGDSQGIELSHVGLPGPPSLGRSRIERVAWHLERKQQSASLVRARYLVLDRAPGTVPVLREMHNDVAEFSLRYLDHGHRWRMRWPPADDSDPAALPLAVEFRLRFAGAGEVRRVVELPPDSAHAEREPQP